MLDPAQIATETGQGFGESFVRRSANSFLLQGCGGIEHRTPSGEAENALLHLQEVRLHKRFDLLAELRGRLTAGFRKGGVNARAEVVKERFGTAMQLVTVQAQDVVQLRLKASEGMLLRGFHALREDLEPAQDLAGAHQRCFDPSGMSLRQIL